MQYLGLGLYVVVEAFIFWPILWIASTFPQFDGVIPQAAILTAALAGGLTTAVLVTGKDFSFLKTGLIVGSWVIMGLIVAAIAFGFQLGLWFSLGLVAFACACIMYYTSAVLHTYRTDQYVAAALALFASIATLFYYILRVLMASRR